MSSLLFHPPFYFIIAVLLQLITVGGFSSCNLCCPTVYRREHDPAGALWKNQRLVRIPRKTANNLNLRATRVEPVKSRGNIPPEIHSGYIPSSDDDEEDLWAGAMEGLDWELEKARRALTPSFAPFSMRLWEPGSEMEDVKPPGLLDNWKILLNNALQMMGLAESIDGAPLVQIVNTYKGSFVQLIARIADGDLAELAGGPLFLLVSEYYERYGPVFKLAFGPKSFIVVSDPVMVKHILKENPQKYDKGILAEILQPVMGKGLIPADPVTWKVRRKAIVPGFHKAWLNAMVSPLLNICAYMCR